MNEQIRKHQALLLQRKWQARLKQKLQAVLQVGQQMSNVLYNLAQTVRPPTEAERTRLKELQEEWDRQRKELPKWLNQR